MPPPRAESARRVGRWLLPAALLALAPKCLLCVLAYAGLGTALGVSGPEICGAAARSTAASTVALAGLAGVGALGAAGRWVFCRRRRPRTLRIQ